MHSLKLKIDITETNNFYNKKNNKKNYYDEILPNLFLGDLYKALDTKDEFDIIINCSAHSYSVNNKTLLYNIYMNDTVDQNINNIIHFTLPIIKIGLLENKKILVHCLMGLSRSPTIVLAFLIYNNKLNVDDGIKFINSKRNHNIDINIGFIYQLTNMENNLIMPMF
jgi:hypothetical protein